MKTDIIFLSSVAIPQKAFNRICLIILLFPVLFSPTFSFAQSGQCDEVPVTLIVEHFGRTELPSILCEHDLYFSVPELFHFLKVKNEASSDFKIIKGFLKDQDDVFLVSEPARQITYNNKVFQLTSEDFIRTRTNLFLRSDHFSKIFGLENEFSSRNLAATLVPDFDLPAVKSAKREQMRENLRRVNGEFSADTTLTRDRPLLQFGAAAWHVNTMQQTDGLFYNQLGFEIGGLFAGGELTGSVNYNSVTKFGSQNLFYQWRHVNNQKKHLRQFTVGKIASRSISTIYRPVIGVQLTNAPTFVKRYFGTYTLSDHTNPDWIVELYINNILIDYTRADASGFFTFDVPLTYGSTDVSLRYYGPWGEEEGSKKQFNIPFNFLSPGELQYTVSSGLVEDGENNKFFNGRADYGLTDRITVGGGIEYLSSLKKNPVIPFLNTSVRLPYNMMFSGEYMHKVGYKGNFSYTSPSSLRLDLFYKKFDEEQEAVHFSYLEERKATLTFPVQMGQFTGTSRFNFQQSLFKNSSYTHLEWLVSGRAWGVRANITNTAFFNQYSDPLVFSKFSTAIRLPGNFVFSPKIEFEYLQDGLTSFEGELRKRFFKKVNFQTSYSHNFKYDQYYINVGLSFDLGFTRMGLNSSANKRFTSISESAGGSVLFEPRYNSWTFDHRPMIGRGSIKFEPFLDLNGNGKKDQTESLIEGVNVHIQGGGMRKQIPGGATIFSGLEPYISYYFLLDARNLKNIAWQVDHKSMEVFVNPNQLRVIEVPVKILGEVAGVVNLGARGIGGIRVNFYDAADKIVSSVLSASDGYFSYMGLNTGEYTARVDESQLEKLKMTVNGDFPFSINNTRDGDYVDNLEFFLVETEKLQPDVTALELQREPEIEEKGIQDKEFSEELTNVPVISQGKEEIFVAGELSEEIPRLQKNTIPKEGLVYKVQFFTSKNAIFEGDPRLKGLRHVVSEKTDAGYRYLWGETRLPGEAARLQNELIRSGFADAYVAHYYKGQRISVEEALKIRRGDLSVISEPTVVAFEIDLTNKDVNKKNTQEGLKFKVQVAASDVQMEPTDSQFMGISDVEEYRHEGMYKYCLGSFNSFGEANQFKNVLRVQGLSDAFVVPFRDNKRLESGQVRGMIYFKDSSLKGIGGISLKIMDVSGNFVSSLLSEADGSFVTPNLKSGQYKMRLDTEELKRIGMRAEVSEIAFKITDGGLQNSEIEFFLSAGDRKELDSITDGKEEGLIFRVQIMASVPKLPLDHPLLKGLRDVVLYKDKGLYKYTIGESKKLKEIRKVKKEVQTRGFSDAFIVSFLNGKRINLQEMNGQVFVREGSEKQGLEGIKIGVFNQEGTQITSLVSKFNGKFSFLGLKPGMYTAGIDIGQLEKLGLRSDRLALDFEIQRNTEGMMRKPVIFNLERINARNDKEKEETNEIEYRIQLAASNVPLGPNHPTLKGIENVSMYLHEGMYKYTVGSTYSLREAKEMMQNIRASHQFSLFIVGFKEGKRVLVVD